MLRACRVLWRLPGFLLILLLASCLAGLLTLLQTLLPQQVRQMRPRLTQSVMRALVWLLPFRVQVHGQPPQGTHLWVANHVSWSDIPLLGQLAPLNFLAKSEVRQWPLIGWLTVASGSLFIRRGGGESLAVRDQMQTHLQAGRALLIFPEGTTSDGHGLRTFHSRLLGCAGAAGIDVQPVAIRYGSGSPCTVSPFVGDDAFISHLLRLLAEPAIEVHLHLLPPLPSQGMSQRELAVQARLQISQVLSCTGRTEITPPT